MRKGDTESKLDDLSVLPDPISYILNPQQLSSAITLSQHTRMNKGAKGQSVEKRMQAQSKTKNKRTKIKMQMPNITCIDVYVIMDLMTNVAKYNNAFQFIERFAKVKVSNDKSPGCDIHQPEFIATYILEPANTIIKLLLSEYTFRRGWEMLPYHVDSDGNKKENENKTISTHWKNRLRIEFKREYIKEVLLLLTNAQGVNTITTTDNGIKEFLGKVEETYSHTTKADKFHRIMPCGIIQLYLISLPKLMEEHLSTLREKFWKEFVMESDRHYAKTVNKRNPKEQKKQYSQNDFLHFDNHPYPEEDIFIGKDNQDGKNYSLIEIVLTSGMIKNPSIGRNRTTSVGLDFFIPKKLLPTTFLKDINAKPQKLDLLEKFTRYDNSKQKQKSEQVSECSIVRKNSFFKHSD